MRNCLKFIPKFCYGVFLPHTSLLFSPRGRPAIGCKSASSETKIHSYKSLAIKFKQFLKKTKYIFPVLFLCLISHQGISQGSWVWMHGDTSIQQPVFGTQGVPSANSNPIARYEGLDWTTPDGKFWLYGGYINGPAYVNGAGARSDLWMFDPSTNMWTWIGGSINPFAPPSYGTQGIANASNTPGTKTFASATWVDNNGDLWLYGGSGTSLGGGASNDLWKYDIGLGQWTWMHGNGTPVGFVTYGPKGVFSPTNTPGCRAESACSWTDQNGKLWYFGGLGSKSVGVQSYMSDLWVYDPAINQWAWMGGDTISNQYGNYGTKGVASATNFPGGRYIYSNWIDSNGDLWLFGGKGYAESGTPGELNDLWKYDINTGMWTWMSGTKVANKKGIYGTQCVGSTNNYPGGRFENRAEWTDDCGNFWLFGGSGYPAQGQPVSTGGGTLNDLWRYNPKTNEWTWIIGDIQVSQPGVLGQPGVPNAGNKPVSRMGAYGWANKDGFWLHGGMLYTKETNVLWKYIPDAPVADFIPDTSSGCGPLTVTFTNNSNPNCNEIKSYLWYFDDPASGPNNIDTSINSIHTFNNNGIYNVKLVVTNCTGQKDSVTKSISVYGPVVNSTSSNVSICDGNAITLSVSGANSYSWFPNNGLSSSTGSAVIANPTITTVYNITGDAGNGCISTTTITVNVGSKPVVTVLKDDSICVNSTITIAAGGASVYSWSPTAGLSSNTDSVVSASPLVTTTYVVVGVNSSNCSDTASVKITVFNLPPVTIGNNITIRNGQSATLSSSGGITYNWFPSGFLNCNTCANPVANPLATTKYYVIITDTNGCTNLDSLIVYVEELCSGDIFIPNVFSPNYDGQNDQLTLNGNCIASLSFIIFDRWGEKIFETNNVTDSWDGIYKGRPLNTGVYIYLLEAETIDGEIISKKGNVSLIR